MFGFGTKLLDDETIGLVAIRAGVLARAQEQDTGLVSSGPTVERWLQFAIKERSVKPNEKSMEVLRYISMVIANDCTGFTDEIFNRIHVKGDNTLTQRDTKRAMKLTVDAMEGASNYFR